MNRNVVPIQHATDYKDVRRSAQEEVSEAAQKGEEHNNKQPVTTTGGRRNKSWHTDEILQVFMLRAGGHTQQEIGAEVGRSKGSVSSLFHKIRKSDTEADWERRTQFQLSQPPNKEERERRSAEVAAKAPPAVAQQAILTAETDLVSLMNEIEDLLLDVATKMEVIRERVKPYIAIAEQLRKL